MQTLLDVSLPRTLDGLVARFGDGSWTGARVEAWLFEDEAARREGERTLRAAGVAAVLRSAYKPLLHAFLEEGLPAGPIALPAHPLAAAGRFRLEAYPLAALMTPAPAFVAGSHALDHACADGRMVFAPNRAAVSAHGRAVLACCGWLRVWRDGAPVLDEALETEFEQATAAVMAVVAEHDWPRETPCFPTLHVAVRTGGIHRPLGVGHECVDTREALHEDLYFSLLELFQARFGRDAGDRTLQPGQIVPEITAGEGPTHVRVTVVAQLAAPAALGPISLEGAERAPDAEQVDAALAALGGERFEARSVQGRAVAAMYHPGTLPGLVVTAGQHANETSGVVGLLRAAETLLGEPDGRVALVALENPDGYAVHRRLCASAPRQMHHAGRYTALGDDLEARRAAPLHEAAARRWAWERTAAVLHISLHGYPAQEWTRPLSGYVPAGFGGWTLPCGFFLILRHHAGLEAQATRFLHALTLALSKDNGLTEMNRAQLALQSAHGGAASAVMLHGIGCRISVSDRSPVPFTLITEYPDETIEGSAFVQAHTVQRDTVVAAARLLWRGLLNVS